VDNSSNPHKTTRRSTSLRGTESKLIPLVHYDTTLIRVLPQSYVPYKYDFDAFIATGSLTKDHSDPSIFTILTARSKTPGVALADFVLFKERWDVATGTFRPPVRLVRFG
jgi:homogentisate 1,2-dioxygenase